MPLARLQLQKESEAVKAMKLHLRCVSISREYTSKSKGSIGFTGIQERVHDMACALILHVGFKFRKGFVTRKPAGPVPLPHHWQNFKTAAFRAFICRQVFPSQSSLMLT